MSIFDDLKEIESKIQSGEIAGFIKFENLAGEAKLLKVEATQNAQGKSFIEMTLKTKEGQTSFGLRIPSKAEKSAAIFMAMQSLKKCLYQKGINNEEDSLEVAFSKLSKMVASKPLTCFYKLREYDSMSSKDGKIYTNQSLESIEVDTSDITMSMMASDDIPF